MLIMLTLIHNNGGSNIIYYEMLSIKIVMQYAFEDSREKSGFFFNGSNKFEFYALLKFFLLNSKFKKPLKIEEILIVKTPI